MATKAKKLAKYSELQDILGKELPINAARLKFIVLLMTSLIKAFWVFHNLPLNTAYYYPKIVQIKGNWVYLSGMKDLNKKGNIEYLIVVSFENTT